MNTFVMQSGSPADSSRTARISKRQHTKAARLKPEDREAIFLIPMWPPPGYATTNCGSGTV